MRDSEEREKNQRQRERDDEREGIIQDVMQRLKNR